MVCVFYGSRRRGETGRHREGRPHRAPTYIRAIIEAGTPRFGSTGTGGGAGGGGGGGGAAASCYIPHPTAGCHPPEPLPCPAWTALKHTHTHIAHADECVIAHADKGRRASSVTRAPPSPYLHTTLVRAIIEAGTSRYGSTGAPEAGWEEGCVFKAPPRTYTPCIPRSLLQP